MTETRFVVLVGVAALFATACASQSSPTVPSVSAANLTAASAPARVSTASVSCTVNIGATSHPLPALHVLQAWLNVSIANNESSLNCGQVNSLDAKLGVVTSKLDQDPPNFDAACGASTALVNEMRSLVERGQLATPTFPPPVPGGPTNALAAAEDLNQHWCDAAHGDLTGPRS
jgi:hypothetical protein